MEEHLYADACATYNEAKFFIKGVAFDGTCSFRPGTRKGPQAIREASYNFESYLFQHDLDISKIPTYDGGDLKDFENVKEMLEAVKREMGKPIRDGKFPIVLGGEHSLTPAVVECVHRKHKDLGYLVIDAHLDFREHYLDEPDSHACSFRRVTDILGLERGISLGVRSISPEENEKFSQVKPKLVDAFTIRDMGIEEAIAKAESVLGNRPIYLSLDMDAIDPAYAPGVGTPEPFGITPEDVKAVINHFAPQLVGFDLVEVSPASDNGNTAALAARLVQEVIASVSKGQ